MKFDLTLRDLDARQIQAIVAALPAIEAGSVATDFNVSAAPVKTPIIRTGAELLGEIEDEVIREDAATIFAAPAGTVQPTPSVAQSPTPAASGSHHSALTGELDDLGMPWDDRIHAGTKTKLAKGGGWKLRRGVDQNVVAAVEAEHRSRGFGSSAAIASVQPTAAVVPAPVSTPAPTTPVQHAPAAGELNFPGLVSKIASSISTGHVRKDTVTALLGKYGLANSGALASRADVWSAFNTDLDVAISDPNQ